MATKAKTDDIASEPGVTAPEQVRARVLCKCSLGEPNDVVEIDAALAETMKAVIDTDPAAVAYAESLAA